MLAIGRISGENIELAYQARGGEGAIDIKQADGVLERTVLERSVRRGRGKSHCEILGLVMSGCGRKERKRGRGREKWRLR
jgi:hypothetical protein